MITKTERTMKIEDFKSYYNQNLDGYDNVVENVDSEGYVTFYHYENNVNGDEWLA